MQSTIFLTQVYFFLKTEHQIQQPAKGPHLYGDKTGEPNAQKTTKKKTQLKYLCTSEQQQKKLETEKKKSLIISFEAFYKFE